MHGTGGGVAAPRGRGGDENSAIEGLNAMWGARLNDEDRGRFLLVRLITTRTWAQIWKYFATVYMAGFGTGGPYETLPVNLVRDGVCDAVLGPHPDDRDGRQYDQ